MSFYGHLGVEILIAIYVLEWGHTVLAASRRVVVEGFFYLS
jgi:hypothetical protein